MREGLRRLRSAAISLRAARRNRNLILLHWKIRRPLETLLRAQFLWKEILTTKLIFVALENAFDSSFGKAFEGPYLPEP